ncbi:virulence factor Mce family protein [Rhodococcoides kyotonense]|uniref:Virulence factor Mce family protein n=2 Tax=Rhodococcoides kyotonense TaxID=398843 RepID=A0A239FA55_9NOCA|nr:virulence factor Mce family protein [Rhodococcus kyotonensis]
MGPSRTGFVMRGVAAAAVLTTAAVASVAYGSGAFDRAPEVYADIPASAGLLVGEIGVLYRGVQVGKVVDIDSGVDRSRVTMQMDPDEMGTVPASALVRVVPRTLFGDVYLGLVDADTPSRRLSAGTTLAVDTSEDAVQLADVYRRVTDLLDRLEPAKAQTALTAISTALHGRGADLGETIDRLASVSAQLEPHIGAALDHTTSFRQVTEALADATPDVLATVDAATTLSRTALDRAGGVEALMATAAGLTGSADTVTQENTDAMITVIHRGATVLDTVSENSVGLAETLDMFEPFGAAGARIFASGRFDITAVPDFSDPLPYTAADCPRYPGLDGRHCALAEVQDAAVGTALPLNPASTMLLAPILQGTEVTIR